MSIHWNHWTRERGLVTTARSCCLAPTRELTVILFDRFLRQLVPHALRGIALASWADRFERLAPLDGKDRDGLRASLADVRALSPVMEAVAATGHQHLFFSSYVRGLEELVVADDPREEIHADAGAWSMACRRLLTLLEPRDVMRATFQAALDEQDPQTR